MKLTDKINLLLDSFNNVIAYLEKREKNVKEQIDDLQINAADMMRLGAMKKTKYYNTKNELQGKRNHYSKLTWYLESEMFRLKVKLKEAKERESEEE